MASVKYCIIGTNPEYGELALIKVTSENDNITIEKVGDTLRNFYKDDLKELATRFWIRRSSY